VTSLKFLLVPRRGAGQRLLAPTIFKYANIKIRLWLRRGICTLLAGIDLLPDLLLDYVGSRVCGNHDPKRPARSADSGERKR